MAEFEADEDATEELEPVIVDEPDQLLDVAHLLRDRRESAAALAALIEELEAQGKTIVEVRTPRRRHRGPEWTDDRGAEGRPVD